MADATSSPEGLHGAEGERENLRGHFRVDEEEPIEERLMRRCQRRYRESETAAIPDEETYGIKEKLLNC